MNKRGISTKALTIIIGLIFFIILIFLVAFALYRRTSLIGGIP